MDQLLFNIERTFKASEKELNALKGVMTECTIEKNNFFLRSGEVCDTLAFITSGSMRLYYDSPNKEICNDFFFENSLIGSIASFMSNLPSIINIVAIEKCSLLTLNKEDIVLLIEKYDTFKNMSNVIIQEQLIRSEKREADLLQISPEERFKNLIEEHPKLFKRIPLHYVASYLSITPETLSRYRTKLLI
ncbi:Crp/Fnr family transcriptional regulator [Mariniflexile gromovii]|uniref:Crp/Fnr family transcriptional regulator n=1 Tax=Mariniflexile gromovii TaxID=362523 RepID=A0ABS4BU13_9FLAO|nr:Crp/Fnr family transcriptional regulator [Mariniflexile gromovii]MBP0904073.1 Crp/Fnr family transcriptional regulator [Mariniflexile gromovii]